MDNIKFYSLTRKGNRAKVNEDYIALPTKVITESMLKKNGYFFVLCDGVGGNTAGEIASRNCARSVFYGYYQSPEIINTSLWIINCIKAANSKIIGIAEDFQHFKGMATTIATALIKNNNLYVSNIGDSRVYLSTPNKFVQISEDQSPAWQKYASGQMSKDEMLSYSLKNLVSEAIGIRKNPEINSYKLSLPEKFTILLCSDGLSDVCTDSEINKILQSSKDIRDCTKDLYNEAIAKGSMDDISIIIASNICN